MPPFTHLSLAYCHSPPLPHRHPQRPEGRSPLSSAPTAHKCLPGCFANCWTEPESPNDEVCTQERGDGLGFRTDRFTSAHPSQKLPGGASNKMEKICGITCRQLSGRAFEQAAHGASLGELTGDQPSPTFPPQHQPGPQLPPHWDSDQDAPCPYLQQHKERDRRCRKMHLSPICSPKPSNCSPHSAASPGW